MLRSAARGSVQARAFRETNCLQSRKDDLRGVELALALVLSLSSPMRRH
jgi:hypothetical protein